MRGRIMRCATVSGTDQDKWRQLYGTTAYGNLPQHKKKGHIGHCWAPCPYDTACDDVSTDAMTGYYKNPFYVTVHRLKIELGVTDVNDIPRSDLRRVGTISGTDTFGSSYKTEHYDVETGKHVYMTTASRGNKWGYECTFSGCPYKTDHGGKNYFYT